MMILTTEPWCPLSPPTPAADGGLPPSSDWQNQGSTADQARCYYNLAVHTNISAETSRFVFCFFAVN